MLFGEKLDRSVLKTMDGLDYELMEIEDEQDRQRPPQRLFVVEKVHTFVIRVSFNSLFLFKHHLFFLISCNASRGCLLHWESYQKAA
jgi:hypothetical protein